MVEKKRILIPGGAGYIGSHVVLCVLLTRRYKVTGKDNEEGIGEKKDYLIGKLKSLLVFLPLPLLRFGRCYSHGHICKLVSRVS